LFLSNALCVLSNGIETRGGSLSAEWEHFFHWLRPEDEKEKIRREQIRNDGTSAKRFLAGLCRKDRLLDYVENFVIYHKDTQKIVAQPKDSEQMRAFLGQNKRLVFTLIQKFRWPKGQAYPLLSERDDIIVIVDEVHRTQYKSLAENMRAGLPNAQYLAFTGTPLLGRDRKTNEWFGDYVSEYNFSQSMDDGATVPLFYKKRVPEVLNRNGDLSDEFYEILETIR